MGLVTNVHFLRAVLSGGWGFSRPKVLSEAVNLLISLMHYIELVVILDGPASLSVLIQ